MSESRLGFTPGLRAQTAVDMNVMEINEGKSLVGLWKNVEAHSWTKSGHGFIQQLGTLHALPMNAVGKNE